MLNRFITLLIVFAGLNMAFAATQSVTTTTTKSSRPEITANGALNLWVWEGNASPGFQLEAVTPVYQLAKNLMLSVGGETGMFFYSKTVKVDSPIFAEQATTQRTQLSGGFVGIPVLAKASLTYDVDPVVKPTFGLATGLIFGTQHVDTARIGLLFEPGIDCIVSKTFALTFQPRLGLYGSDFVFVPQVGAAITL